MTFEQDLNKWCLNIQDTVVSLKLDVQALKTSNKITQALLTGNLIAIVALIASVVFHL